jgi:class 3 adenylate cyclase
MPWLGDQDAALDEIQEFLTGVRPHPALDRVLATVLFTDIVGSTELAADLGDPRWQDSILDAARALGLQMRFGLHTGELELAGSEIRGIAVHTGARVASKAGRGEVLASSTVKDLVAGSGLEFEYRGSHELKGVPGEWRLYAVSNA